ncbi:Bro-N domain-containing protein [Streptomyces microflavus]|uniref:BRO-N domain-containing protein n=1 Tax=Streptomyces microflavus TaxID=1919 RepID=UPI002E3296A8|nr:Bro-N domain-containing protein [Streptomyces microflavus]
MSAVQLFNVSGSDIRFGVTEHGTPYAVASDYAKAMGYGQASDATRLLGDDEKGQQIVLTPGGPQRLNVIFEDGMWELIFRSTLPGAKEIKKRVKAILREIRETGRFEAEPVPEVTAAAGALPYREQAEVLAILRPVLPESYAVATGKVIMARAMGERPELDSAETPLYASTFLAEKGHKPTTVAKFQSGFGARVSNRYLKVRGKRPEKIPGPAGSRIDKVVAYVEDDRPLLEQVYAGIADEIRMFETGGQVALGA